MHSHTVSRVGGASHDALYSASIHQRRALPEEPGLTLQFKAPGWALLLLVG